MCLMAGGLLVKTWRQSVTRRDVRYVPKRDVRALHDVTSDMSQNVTSERYTTWSQICPKTWRHSVTRREVRYVPKRDVTALHDVKSDVSQNVTSQRYTTWRQICPTKDKISLHGSFTRMHLLPRAYRNRRTRILFDASGYFSSSAIPLCACPVTCNSRYDNWTLIGRMRTTWPSNLNVTR